jgi:hypothetical protein
VTNQIFNMWAKYLTCEEIENHLYKTLCNLLIKIIYYLTQASTYFTVTTLRVTSWDKFTLINRILQIRFIVLYLIKSHATNFQFIFIKMIIIESSSTNIFLEIFHLAENDNWINVDTEILYENELNLVTANRIFINKFDNYLFVQ